MKIHRGPIRSLSGQLEAAALALLVILVIFVVASF